jgi:Holliday junction resolvase
VSGARHRRKGDRLERAVVRVLQGRGLAAERVPLSGAARGRFGGDVSVPLLGRDRRIEVKARSSGFRQLYDWLGDHDFLIVKADRREPLVILPLSLATEIATIAERAKGRSRAYPSSNLINSNSSTSSSGLDLTSLDDQTGEPCNDHAHD